MKKLLALAAATLIALAPIARADGWQDGLSAGRPFSYVDECDLTQRVGYIMTMPENATFTPCGIDALTLYLPREDVNGMHGTLTVTDSSGAICAESDLSNAEIAPMSDSDLDFYGWGGGTAIVVRLNRALAGNGVYSINIPEGAFDLELLTVKSAALDGEKQWTFATYAYGISAQQTITGTAAVGDSVSARVLLGGDAVNARLTIDTPQNAQSKESEFTQDSDFTVTFTAAGNVVYSMDFYDAAGSLIGAVEETISVK